MTLRNWLRSWTRPTSPATRRRYPLRAALETLEDRTVPSGFALAFGADMTDGGTGSSARDAAGNLYVSGRFLHTVDFDPGPAERTLTSAGEDDTFLAKYGPDGAFLWARRVGSPGADRSVAGGAWASVAVTPDGTIAFSTAFTGTASVSGVNGDGSVYTSPTAVTAAGTVDALVGTFGADGTLGWVRAIGGAGAVLQPRPVGITPDGSLIVAGSFTGTVDTDPTGSHPNNRDVLTSAGGEDVFAAKFTAAGAFAWATRAGDAGTESAMVTVDAVGNAYLWGRSNSETIAFGSQTLTRRSTHDAFVTKLDATTGAFVWARQIASGGSVGYGGSAAYHDPGEADPNRGNAIYVSGNVSSNGTVVFGGTTVTFAQTDGWDGYLAKFDGDGNFVWARQIEGGNHVGTQLMTTDAVGNVYSNVYTTGTGVTDFDPGPGEALVAARPGASVDGHLLKLSAAGAFEWVRPAGRYLRPAVGAEGAVYGIGTYDAATREVDTGSGSLALPAPPGDSRDMYLLKIDQNALGGVFGRVLYAGGYPAEGATVTLKQNGAVVATATAGVFGEFVFRHMAVGSYTLEALGGSRAVTLTAAGQFLTDQTVTPATPALGTKFFVVNDGFTDRTYQYTPVGTANASTALATGNTAPRGAASNKEGTQLWVVDANKTVYVYNAAGALLGSWTSGLSGKMAVEGIATDGKDVWLVATDGREGTVYRYANAGGRLSGSQKPTSSFTLGLQGWGIRPTGIVTDGASLWVVGDWSGTADYVFKYTVAGVRLGSWTLDPANGSPTGITIDPNNVGHIWVVDNVALKVFQYSDAAGRTSGSQRADRTFALDPGNTNPQDIADPPAPDSLLSTVPLAEDVTVPPARPGNAGGNADGGRVARPTPHADNAFDLPGLRVQLGPSGLLPAPSHAPRHLLRGDRAGSSASVEVAAADVWLAPEASGVRDAHDDPGIGTDPTPLIAPAPGEVPAAGEAGRPAPAPAGDPAAPPLPGPSTDDELAWWWGGELDAVI